MEINFLVNVNNDGWPEVIIDTMTPSGQRSVPVDIEQIIEIIPLDLIVIYKDLLNNKIINSVPNNIDSQTIKYSYQLKFISNFIDNLGG